MKIELRIVEVNRRPLPLLEQQILQKLEVNDHKVGRENAVEHLGEEVLDIVVANGHFDELIDVLVVDPSVAVAAFCERRRCDRFVPDLETDLAEMRVGLRQMRFFALLAFFSALFLRVVFVFRLGFL